MIRHYFTAICLAPLFLIHAYDAAAAEPGEKPGVVSFVKVKSDKVPDISSMEAWKAAYIKPDMTNQEKMIAVWKTVATFQHQDSPPIEFLQHEDIVYDPIKVFNVYGYAFCANASAHLNALARHIGFEARGWAIYHHAIPEVKYDDEWHHFDSSIICYFPKPDGKVASVEEITKGVKEWYAKNPEYFDGKHGLDKNLRQFERQDNRTAWKTKGPEVLSRAPTFDAKGWWPAGTHGWYATMQAFDGTTGDRPAHIYEYAASQGYQVNVQLRKGERLTRNWGHKGLHINSDLEQKDPPGCMKDEYGFLKKYDSSFGGSLAPGRVGNGTLEYNVPLANGEFLGGTLASENLAFQADKAPAVRVKDPAAAGTFVIRMPSSYVYLSGELTCKPVLGAGGSITVSFSDNNGLDWKDVAVFKETRDEKIDLKPLVYRRYDYRLRFEMKGSGTGLDALKLSHDVQHSQRPLPALDKGENTLTFSAGPQEGTITVEANTRVDHKGKQLLYTDFHPELSNMQPSSGSPAGSEGHMTFPISTPGEMVRLRFGGHYLCEEDADSWTYQVSFDGAKTFRTIATAPFQNRGRTYWVTVNDIPAGTRTAHVRYAAKQKNVARLWSFRIDADYKEPNGGFAPVKITYQWDEDGEAKQSVHIAKSEQEVFKISCAAKPLMRSFTVERAD
jgi:hypothetical protein